MNLINRIYYYIKVVNDYIYISTVLMHAAIICHTCFHLKAQLLITIYTFYCYKIIKYYFLSFNMSLLFNRMIVLYFHKTPR